ncbi:hypothetical protein EVAR_64700_1 [Eumeta japonica]|uniref:Uncharacterized protein n=1 Tax=Eumeta variegata TaxID=151549 RepID=A0A4C1ZPR1_EUMVA|nr:hypothetical protein EVAR_64700_1 [Eumeta japonica]
MMECSLRASDGASVMVSYTITPPMTRSLLFVCLYPLGTGVEEENVYDSTKPLPPDVFDFRRSENNSYETKGRLNRERRFYKSSTASAWGCFRVKRRGRGYHCKLGVTSENPARCPSRHRGRPQASRVGCDNERSNFEVMKDVIEVKLL